MSISLSKSNRYNTKCAHNRTRYNLGSHDTLEAAELAELAFGMFLRCNPDTDDQKLRAFTRLLLNNPKPKRKHAHPADMFIAKETDGTFSISDPAIAWAEDRFQTRQEARNHYVYKYWALRQAFGTDMPPLTNAIQDHWTDKHIRQVAPNRFIAYDEAGLEHGRYSTRHAARDALTKYATNQR